ncbi:MAG: DUF6036 family nucleotidyltransferase [Pseudomonadota bacterium]
MTLDALFDLLRAAQRLCGHAEYVVVGSVSVLGMSEVTALPADMTVSIDADCYTRLDPGRVFDLQGALGEGSAYHRAHGIYLDPVSPKLPTLPEGWEARLIRLERDGVVAAFLDPNDAAISKLARSEPRDLRWVRAGIQADLVSLPVLKLRSRGTSYFDDEERARVTQALQNLANPSPAAKRRG